MRKPWGEPGREGAILSAKRLHRWLLGWFAVLTVVQPQNSLAEPLDHWQLKAPITQWHSIRISYGNGIFVAVGEPGALYTSSDGETWTWRSSGTNQSLRDVSYGGGTFVAVGKGGTIASSDGFTWSARDSGTHQGLNKIAFGKDTFIAAGRNGTLLASPDGAVWTPQPSGTHGHLDGIAYGKDTFVAVGEAILTSSDGKAWTEKKAGASHRIFGVAYGGGVFAAVADNGGILTSSDASEWTAIDTGVHLTLFAIAHGKERFLASGERGILLLSEPLPSPQISVSSTSLDFGSVKVGDSSFTNLTISNSGSANLIIRQMTFSGADTLDFNTRNDNCTGVTLSQSQSCTVQIVFSPHSTGSKSATLSISSNDPDTPTQTVSLSGSSSGVSAISGSTGSFCFISFSTFGSELDKYLDLLREFRDVFLIETRIGRTVVDFYYHHSPAMNQVLARHDFLRRTVAIGLVPPLAAIAYVTLRASPTEKAILFLLMAGAMTAGWRLIRRSGRNWINRRSDASKLGGAGGAIAIWGP